MYLFKQKNFKKAFTMMEIMIAMSILAIVSGVFIQVNKTSNFADSGNFLMANKAIENVNNSIGYMRQNETWMIPSGQLMIKNAAGNYEFAVLNENKNMASETEFADLLGGYMKQDGNIINFCDISGACTDTSIKGFKLPGGLYIGFKKYNTAQDCPTFKLPGSDETSEPAKNFDGTTKKCWGEFYIDINGEKAPNALNEDYYVFGMDEYGIVTTGEKVAATEETIEETSEEETASEPAMGG